MTSMRPCSPLTFAGRGVFAAATATATLSLAACPTASTPEPDAPSGTSAAAAAQGTERSEEDRRAAMAERFECSAEAAERVALNGLPAAVTPDHWARQSPAGVQQSAGERYRINRILQTRIRLKKNHC